MVLHIGCDAFVPLSSVVAVLDAASQPDLVSELSPPSCGGCEVRSIGKGAEVTDSVIMPDVVIENGVSIRNAIIAEGCVIRAGAKIGGDVENGERRISVIGKEKVITEGAVIEPGAII